MMVIGVTGGMASGKTSIAQMIARDGIRHVDADKLVHSLMNSDIVTIDLLGESFPKALTETGAIDRAVLAQIVTQDPESLKTLEAILHPRVRAAESEAILEARNAGDRAIVLDIPLLFETDAQELCDVVIVAHAPIELRRQRAFERPGMTEEKWRRLLDRQLPDEHRLSKADHVIHTSGDITQTAQQVNALMKEWGLL